MKKRAAPKRTKKANHSAAAVGSTFHVSNAVITEMNCTVYGDNNTITGMNATVYGNANTVTGMNADVYGDFNTVSGMESHATGNNNLVTGMGSTATGDRKQQQQGSNGPAFVFTNHPGSIIGNQVTGDEAQHWQQQQQQGVAFAVGSSGPDLVFNNHPGNQVVHSNHADQEDSPAAVEIVYVEGPAPNEIDYDIPLPEDAAEDDSGCAVCLTNRAICIVWPCRHACLCVACARVLCFSETDILYEVGKITCPKCRAVVEKVLRIH